MSSLLRLRAACAALGALAAHYLAAAARPAGRRQGPARRQLARRRVACGRSSQRFFRLLSLNARCVEADLAADLRHLTMLQPHGDSACCMGLRHGAPWRSEACRDRHRCRGRWISYFGEGARRPGLGIPLCARRWRHLGLFALCSLLRATQ